MVSEQRAYERSLQIKQWASDIGFDFCGISTAAFLSEEAPRLETWLRNGHQGQMTWMENHFDKRLDPRKLVEGAKSVISVLLNYTPDDTSLSEGPIKISRYAYGKDYHFVLKDKLRTLLERIQTQIGEVNGRVFVDSAPVMDKVWAAKSGLGWVGKHSNLLTKQNGSYFFIGEIILDLELYPDGQMKDYCGTCTRCIDACPTQAITEPYVVDGSKCISYLTIELKDAIPKEFKPQMEGWAFGCDICQEVCPWNRFAKGHKNEELFPSEELVKWHSNSFSEITEEIFRVLFKDSPIKRTTYNGLRRNLRFLLPD
ncbi:MAG: tRNA epoxyqueuosine(34) reductase QueG [Cytophagaceae bacterium]|jgi:epoxyqueuosine reductase|nr:tRNA epoxyqueuosine(34) reductase QueG [Cytophagaceae bacterium]